MDLTRIKKDLESLSCHDVVLFGSTTAGKNHARSDIDIAIITRSDNEAENNRVSKNLIGKFHPCYDIKIFELLPLDMKIAIMECFEVIFGNRADITEYFYFYRKLWADCKDRIEQNRYTSVKEKRDALQRQQLLRV